ncbi:MAG: sulfotransferase domain-containing protein [Pirellulales bacterium]
MSRLTKAWRSTRFYRSRIAWRLPKLLVIGAQKCGTSALFHYLAQHPRLVPSIEKEVEFFQSDLRYGYGMEWYANRWPTKVPAGAVRFEASPAYLATQGAAERIRRWLPDVRIVAILRDPVLRAYSAWQMYRQQLADDPEFYRKHWTSRYFPAEVARIALRTAEELDDFQLAIEREAACLERGQTMEWSVLELGLYGPQLKSYFELFRPEQLLVLDSNDLRTRRVRTLNRVLAFLGLPESDWVNTDLGDVFVGKWGAPMSQRVRDYLSDYYRESNQMLAEMLELPPLFVREPRDCRASA